MKEFTVEIPADYEIDKQKSTRTKILFKKIESKLPKTWEDLESVSGCFVNDSSAVCVSHSRSMTTQNKNVFPTRELAKASVALAQLLQLRDRYRGEWKPNWSDDNMAKYCVDFIENSIRKNYFFSTNRIFSFQSREIRDKFYNNFKDNLLKEVASLFNS